MNTLTKKQKLDLVIELTKEHQITAYEIGSNTELNTSGVQKLLKGEVDNPRNSTLNIILDYIEKRNIGRNVPGHPNYNPDEAKTIVAEPSETDYKKEANNTSATLQSNQFDMLHDMIRTRDQVIELLTEQRDMLKARVGELSEKVKFLDEQLKKTDKQHG